MGVVWRAHDELLRRDVAVKELHVRVGVDGDLRLRQVLREARAAARLRHPGVVAVHDVVVDGGRPLILMELVEGFSLAERVRQQGPLSERRVAEVGARVLEALSVAHAQGVVHRDVKPANILLDGERVVLTDFGIAAVVSETTGSSSSLVGSLDYLAPERVNGEVASPASDVWSVGVTLCAALRGESPFARGDTQATLAAVLTFEPVAIPQAPRLWRVLELLLRKDPRQRLTAAAASAMLAAIANGSAADAPAEPIPEPAFVPEPNGRHVVRQLNRLTGEPVAEPTAAPTAAPMAASMSAPVVEPETAHVVEPIRDSPTGARARARRMSVPLAALVAVLVLVAAGGIWLIVRPGGDVAGTATGTRPAVSAPAGFTAHSGDGFAIAIPRGWFKDPSEQEIFWVSDPHSPRIVLAHLEWWDDAPPGGAYRELADLERGDFLDVDFITDYKRIKLAKLPAAQGTTRAELEMVYHVDEDGGYDLHERMHAFVTATGRTYILTVSSQGDTRAQAERLWRTQQDELTAILGSFRITD